MLFQFLNSLAAAETYCLGVVFLLDSFETASAAANSADLSAAATLVVGVAGGGDRWRSLVAGGWSSRFFLLLLVGTPLGQLHWGTLFGSSCWDALPAS